MIGLRVWIGCNWLQKDGKLELRATATGEDKLFMTSWVIICNGKKPGKSRISSVDQWRDRVISRVSYRTKRPRLAKSTRREVMKWNSRIVLRNEPIRGGKPVSSLQLYWLVQLVFSKLSPSGYTKKSET